MRSTSPATASTRTGSAAISPSPAQRRSPRRPIIAGAPAQRHPDRARKHPRRRDRPPRRRPAADADARRARRPRQRARARAYSAMSASPPTRCRACSPASWRRSTTASRWSAISSPTAIEVGIFSGQAEDFGDTANLVGMRRGAIFVDGDMLKDERAFSFAAQGSVNIDGKILLREFDRRLGRPRGLAAAALPLFQPAIGPFPLLRAGHGPDPARRADPARRDRRRPIATGSRAPIWNAIAYNDRLIGALIGRLRRLGVLDNTLDRGHRRPWRIPVRRRLPRPRPYAQRAADADPVHPQRAGRRDARR